MEVKVKLIKKDGTVTRLQVPAEDLDGESMVAHKDTIYRFTDSGDSDAETECTFVETEDPFKVSR